MLTILDFRASFLLNFFTSVFCAGRLVNRLIDVSIGEF